MTALPRPSTSARFAWCWSLVVVAAVLLAVPLLNLVLLNWRGDPNVRWVDELWRRKVEMAQAAKGQPRIFIVGGSSALFSVDAEVLQARLGRPVINLGMLAGLGLRIMLENARDVAAAGDTILLHVEYQPYQWNHEIKDIQRQVMLTTFPERLVRLPARDAINLTYGAPWAHYAEGWERRNTEMRCVRPSTELPGARYTTVELSRCGDHRADGEIAIPGMRRFALEPLASGVSPESAELLRDFLQWCRQRGVRVVAMRPPGLHVGNPSPEVIEAAYHGMEPFFSTHGVPMLETREIFQVPRAMMLDTAYHANTGGRRVFTEIIVKELRRVLELPTPSGAHPVLLTTPAEHNGAGREIVRPEQELSGCRFLSEKDLLHPSTISPDGVRALLRENRQIIINDRETEAILRKTDLVLVPGESKRSTLAAWMQSYPNHLFAMAQVGSFDTASLAEKGLPEPVRAFLKNPAPCKVGVFGTGAYAKIKGQRVKPDEAGWERSRYSSFANPFPHPVDIALYSGPRLPAIAKTAEAKPAATSPALATPVPAAIRIDHCAIEEGATPGLAVAILDPQFGLVLKHAVFTGPELLEWQQYEVRLPASGPAVAPNP